MSIIIIHELGHFLTAKILKVGVDKVYIYPFGGVCKLKDNFNGSLLKEFLVLSMGPLTQIIFCYGLIKINCFPNYNHVINHYNHTFLMFNLLPIYPLDGSKLINILCSSYYSFKKSLYFTLYFSFFVIFILTIYFVKESFTINYLFILLLLIFKLVKEYQKRYFVVEKFLLERYLKNPYFKKIKEVKHINEFMRNRRHIIDKNGKYYSEREVLREKFEKNL